MRQGKHVHSDGTEIWYKDGKPHRLDGPAITYPGGAEKWCTDDKWRWSKDGVRWPAQHREWWERDSESHIRRFLRWMLAASTKVLMKLTTEKNR